MEISMYTHIRIMFVPTTNLDCPNKCFHLLPTAKWWVEPSECWTSPFISHWIGYKGKNSNSEPLVSRLRSVSGQHPDWSQRIYTWIPLLVEQECLLAVLRDIVAVQLADLWDVAACKFFGGWILNNSKFTMFHSFFATMFNGNQTNIACHCAKFCQNK